MRTLPTILSCAALAVVLAGCGSLEVSVAVLNPTVLEAESDRQILRQLPLVAALTENDAKAQVNKYEEAHFAFIKGLARQYSIEARAVSDPEMKSFLASLSTSLLADYGKIMPPYYQEVSNRLVATLDAVHALTRPDQRSPDVQAQLVFQLRLRAQILKELEARVSEEIAGVTADLSVLSLTRRNAVLQARQVFEVKRRTILPGASIGDDPLAFAVAGADKALWKDQFNRVIGKGYMGNLNVAVKLEESGSYTIKGLTFDPSDVARVAGKVTTQALLLATQIAGVPVQTQPPTNAPTGTALATSSKAIAEAERARAQQNLLLLSHKDALQAFAGTVLREWPALDSDTATKRKAGIAAVRAAFAANQSRLRLETTPAGPTTRGDDSNDDTGNEQEEDLN